MYYCTIRYKPAIVSIPDELVQLLVQRVDPLDNQVQSRGLLSLPCFRCQPERVEELNSTMDELPFRQ